MIKRYLFNRRNGKILFIKVNKITVFLITNLLLELSIQIEHKLRTKYNMTHPCYMK